MAAQKHGTLVFHQATAAVEAYVMKNVSDPVAKATLLLDCIRTDQAISQAIREAKSVSKPPDLGAQTQSPQEVPSIF